MSFSSASGEDSGLGGEFMGVEAPAGPYSRDFMAAYRFADGRIAERWAIRDDLGMLRQLGAL
jgi:predicted ester cyclase